MDLQVPSRMYPLNVEVSPPRLQTPHSIFYMCNLVASFVASLNWHLEPSAMKARSSVLIEYYYVVQALFVLLWVVPPVSRTLNPFEHSMCRVYLDGQKHTITFSVKRLGRRTLARILRQWKQINLPRRPVLLFPTTGLARFNGLHVNEVGLRATSLASAGWQRSAIGCYWRRKATGLNKMSSGGKFRKRLPWG